MKGCFGSWLRSWIHLILPIKKMSITYPEITVCICTYNRSSFLARTLESFMKAPMGYNWELLIVDNNSKDDTRDVVQAFGTDLPVRYVMEAAQGLSYARNQAIQECLGELLIFTDDDVQVSSSWLNEFITAAKLFPEADYFGGRVLPYWPAGRPSWLKDEGVSLLGGLFVCYDLGTEVRMYRTQDPTPYGASFAIRRRLFDCLDPFRIDLGVTGNIPGRGEESEYLSRARECGFSGAYVGTAVCYHWVDPIRLRLSYMYRFGIQKGIAEVKMYGCQNLKGSLSKEFLFAVRGLFQLAKGRGDRFRQCIIMMGIQAGLRHASRQRDQTQ